MSNIYDKASLVLIPSGTKTSKVYSQVPVNGDGDFTFSRSTAATRVNADGNIEKETENLLLQSNTFDTTWVTANASVTGGQNGYDGSSDAWLLQNNAGFTTTANVRQNLSLGSSVRSFSVYARKGNVDWMRILMYDGSIPHQCWFNLTNGSTANASDIIDAKSTSVGGGWYRCEILANTNIESTNIYPTSVAGSSFSDNGDNILIQDAQLEQGLVARDYIETTTAAVEGGITDNVPRLDYTGGATCPSLLLEPSRTNSYLFSEPFQNEGTSGGVTYESFNWAIGFVNCIKYGDNSTIRYRYGGSVSASTEYTLSAFVIMDDLSEPVIGGQSSGNDFLFVLGGNTHDNANPSVNMGNNIWRVSVTATTSSSPNVGNNGIIKYTSQSSKGFRVVGLQLEAGSYPTSYIPTYGTSVTRNQDACLKTGVSDLIGQPNGSVFLDFVYDNNFANTRIFSISENSWISGGSIRLEKSSGKFRWNWVDANTTAGALTSTTTMVVGTRYRIAITYTATSASLFLNGVKEDTSSVTTPTQMNQIHLNELGGGFIDANEFQRNVFNQVLIFNSTLTDQEAIDLTTI